MVGARVGICVVVATMVEVGVLLIEIRVRVGSIPGMSAEVVSADAVSANMVSANAVPADVVSANVVSTDMVSAGVVPVAVLGAGDCEGSGSGL